MSEKSVFETLVNINVSDHTEQKNGLTYLSWAWAWDTVKRIYPDATYTIWRSEYGLPYVFDPTVGYMVFTSVTIEGITHDMWLPVMDNSNNALKSMPYVIHERKYGKEVETQVKNPCNMFDVNKAIMRCLVKNLAMFGLGLYIYSGEDLPAVEKAEIDPKEDAMLRAKVLAYVTDSGFTQEEIAKLCKHYGVDKIVNMSGAQCKDYIAKIEAKGGKVNG